MARVPGMVLEVGPENDDGDPIWIRPKVQEGGARSGDRFYSYGRRNARIYPALDHPVQTNPLPLLRHGYRLAIERWNTALKDLPSDLSVEQADALSPYDSPTALALIAAHDLLEWVAAMQDYLRTRDESGDISSKPSDIDPEFGPYVEGILGARNALHHKLAMVLGFVNVAPTDYVAVRDRWELAGIAPTVGPLQARWAEEIPRIRSKHQWAAFHNHLAGRVVTESFVMATHYFWKRMGTPEEPYVASGPADHPPPIDPAFQSVDVEQPRRPGSSHPPDLDGA